MARTTSRPSRAKATRLGAGCPRVRLDVSLPAAKGGGRGGGPAGRGHPSRLVAGAEGFALAGLGIDREDVAANRVGLVSAGGDLLAVGPKRHGASRSVDLAQEAYRLAPAGVPETNRAVAAAGDQPF